MTKDQRPKTKDDALVDVVVKLGGGLLVHPVHFEAVLAVIRDAASERRLLIVPGGGPFADAVRHLDRQFRLSDDAAHWMAVLAMDQYAHLVVSRLAGGLLVADPSEAAAAFGAGRLPVLAPSRWVRDADPLPHSWDVTSDSIAAWVAGVIGARHLILVKPPGAGGGSVDECFHRTLPAHVTSAIVVADQLDALAAAMRP